MAPFPPTSRSPHAACSLLLLSLQLLVLPGHASRYYGIQTTHLQVVPTGAADSQLHADAPTRSTYGPLEGFASAVAAEEQQPISGVAAAAEMGATEAGGGERRSLQVRWHAGGSCLHVEHALMLTQHC